MVRFYNAICALGLVLCGLEGKAQQIIWSENFDYRHQQNFGPPWRSTGWISDNDYYIGSVCAPKTDNNTPVAGVSGYWAVSNNLCEFMWNRNPDRLLETPLIDIRGRQHPRLRFDSHFRGLEKAGIREAATVEISLDSGATWSALGSPAPARVGKFNSSVFDLSAYTGSPGAIRIGFRYDDNRGNMPGWLIDNLAVYEPESVDLQLIATNQDDTLRNYHQAGSSVSLEGTVVNAGTTPVSGFTAFWQEGAGLVHSTTISGVNLRPMDSARFTHTDPLPVAAAAPHRLRMWIALPGDQRVANDSLRFVVNGCQFMPRKTLVIEEGTGTWNIGGPRGDVFLHRLDTAAAPPVRISIHANDVLQHDEYSNFLYRMRQIFAHYFLLDRRGTVHPDAFFERVYEARSEFGFANLDVRPRLTGGVLSMDVDVRPAVDLPGRYRIAMIVTEDNVRGATPAYNQANGFTNNNIGPMGGYESKPHPVPAAQMRYDYVARPVSTPPEGRTNLLGANPQAGQLYTANFVVNIGLAYKKEDLNVIALLIRESDSTIVNAASRRLNSLSVAGQPGGRNTHAFLTPNPASNATTLDLNLPGAGTIAITVQDLSGRVVSAPKPVSLQQGPSRHTISTGDLASGIYIVRIDGKDFHESLKLSVVR